MVEMALVAPTPSEVSDRVAVKAMSSTSPYTALVDRWNAITNAPAEEPPLFFAVLESARVPAGATLVVVVDSAVVVRSGRGTKT